jgi:hypothetical protein
MAASEKRQDDSTQVVEVRGLAEKVGLICGDRIDEVDAFLLRVAGID